MLATAADSLAPDVSLLTPLTFVSLLAAGMFLWLAFTQSRRVHSVLLAVNWLLLLAGILQLPQ